MRTLATITTFLTVLVVFFLITWWLLSLIAIQAGVGTFIMSVFVAIFVADALNDELK